MYIESTKLPIFSLVIVLLAVVAFPPFEEVASNTSPITMAKFSIFMSKSSAEGDDSTCKAHYSQIHELIIQVNIYYTSK